MTSRIEKMAEVHAVKDAEMIKVISRKLANHHAQHFADIWDFGIQVALRVSDILAIKHTDIKNGRLSLVEGKTGKTADIQLNSKALAIVEQRKADAPEDVFLFQSKHRNVKTVKALSRQSVTNAFSQVGFDLGIQLGTHSMRKTRGYHQYKRSNDIASVMTMLRHSNQGVTLRYIGITQEDTDNAFMEMVL